jgi:26S proteasome regulatory subunit N6
LLKQLKKHDDKINQINLHVYESIAQYELKNLSRAKSALSSARALAVSTFCPAVMQAQIDKLSGMYICDDKNYGTAFSYFMESMDGFIMEKRGDDVISVSRYILLSKIIGEKYDQINPLLKKLDNKTTRCGFNLLDDPIVKIYLVLKEIYQNIMML